MNKTALHHIDRFAKALPVLMHTAAFYQQKISGADLLLAGTKEVEGTEVLPEKDYYMKVPVNREIDHKARMKNAYKKRGKDGLISYLRPYIKPEKFGEVQVFIMKAIPK